MYRSLCFGAIASTLSLTAPNGFADRLIRPSALRVMDGEGGIKISWGDRTVGEERFEIQRRSTEGSFRRVAVVDRNMTHFVDRKAKKREGLQYRIRALSDRGRSRFSYSNRLSGSSHQRSVFQRALLATVRKMVEVPSSLRQAPFNVDRFLNVPPEFNVSVYARVDKARFMTALPNGDLLVSQPSSGKVLLLRPNANGLPTSFEFASGLRRPHDMVLHTIGETTYLYVAETHQINRYRYTTGDTTARDREVVITGLPDSSTPELGGNYGHELKNIALDSDHKLYVSIASTCNACVEDTVSEPVRGAIYIYDADGSNGRIFARGLRNAEGLDFVPGTKELWVAVNGYDPNLAHSDFNGVRRCIGLLI